MPADYVDEGVWAARWLSEQIARFITERLKEKTKRGAI